MKATKVNNEGTRTKGAHKACRKSKQEVLNSANDLFINLAMSLFGVSRKLLTFTKINVHQT